jgi:hypothetical protein
MQIRDVILGCFMVGWVTVTIITAFRSGSVPAELWAVPGVGIGALMALFRDTKSNEEEEDADEPDKEPS